MAVPSHFCVAPSRVFRGIAMPIVRVGYAVCAAEVDPKPEG
jgi:hypothetical protein